MERKNHEISFKCIPIGRFEISDNTLNTTASTSNLESAVRMLRTARIRAEEYQSRFRYEHIIIRHEPIFTMPPEILERDLVNVY